MAKKRQANVFTKYAYDSAELEDVIRSIELRGGFVKKVGIQPSKGQRYKIVVEFP